MAESWDRIVKETMPAYKAFCIYRDLGDSRSIDAAYCHALGYERGTKSASNHWRRWSARYAWVDRAGAYDLYLEAKDRKRNEGIREKAKQLFSEKALVLAAELIALALQRPEFVEIGDDVKLKQPSAAQVNALKEALNRAGVTVPQEIELKEAIPFTFIMERPADE